MPAVKLTISQSNSPLPYELNEIKITGSNRLEYCAVLYQTSNKE